MADFFLLLESVLLPLVSIAATTSPTVLPSDVNYTDLAVAHVYGSQFSSDPATSYQLPAVGSAPLEVLIFGQGQPDTGTITYRVAVKNTGNAVARQVALGVTHPIAMQLVSVDPAVNDQITNAGKTELMWFLSDLAPGQQTGVTAQFTKPGEATVGAQVSFTYGGQARVAGTTHRVLGEVAQAVDEAPPAPEPAATRSPQPVIICDPAEVNCIPISPNLGVNFRRVQQQDSHPVICSKWDPACQPKRPVLGERFQEAVAVTEPGECWVEEDAIISNPAYHDSFLRKTEPAAAYMRPLFDSGQDFKQLVHQAILDSIKHNIQARDKLWSISSKYWRQHQEIVQQVLADELSGVEAITRLQTVLTQWTDEIKQAQVTLRQDYQNIRTRREARYDPLADKAAVNAADSITRAGCPVQGEDGALRARLEETKFRAYIPTLDESVVYYGATTEPQFAALVSTVRNHWESVLYPALRAYDADNQALLKNYDQLLLSQLFDKAFRSSYIAQADRDEDRLEEFRLNEWEIALDTPKTIATECEFTNKVVKLISPVELTRCESGTYPQGLVRSGAETVKGKAGQLVPPADLSPLGPGTAINAGAVQGLACGGRPGDPAWAPNCECKCGQDVADADGNIVKCEVLFKDKITRHDIFVEDKEECEQDGPKHADPYF